jgi:hypothetical protein
VRAPGLYLDDVRLFDQLDAHMRALAAERRVRSPNDAPLPRSSVIRSPIFSCIGRTRCSVGCASGDVFSTGFFAGRDL